MRKVDFPSHNSYSTEVYDVLFAGKTCMVPWDLLMIYVELLRTNNIHNVVLWGVGEVQKSGASRLAVKQGGERDS